MPVVPSDIAHGADTALPVHGTLPTTTIRHFIPLLAVATLPGLDPVVKVRHRFDFDTFWRIAEATVRNSYREWLYKVE